MRFLKYHALGNDYLVYADSEPFPFNDAAVVRICEMIRARSRIFTNIASVDVPRATPDNGRATTPLYRRPP